ncbi:hypothetical protein SLE2022_198790 [Rubroshorea leprosula]
MAPKICMNSSCRTASTPEWKKGWPLRSGGYADLCYTCGSAYEKSVFCDTFHLEETGWRDCYKCTKRLHCGCIASKFLLELLDFGGVGCTMCAKSSQLPLARTPMHGDGIPNGFVALTINNAGSSPVESGVVGDNIDERKLAQLCKMMEAEECHLPLQSQRGDANTSFREDKREEVIHPIGEMGGASSSNPLQPCIGSSKFSTTDIAKTVLDIRDMHDSLPQASLSMTLVAPSRNSNTTLPFSSGVADEREQGKTSPPFQQGQRSQPIWPKPSKNGLAMSPDTNKSTVSQMRIARPPVEGRGKSHLLPRYWPRITDQELQQLSGDLNSTIVPLFEKVLSASDAGRIGRLVLPKACAEAYFPTISQSEGIPLRIQDVKGKEWMFQFRFWPNNNSRMYVLEGVTPCIQSMQLQAGDTVMFSRIDPGGKLVMGFRKAANPDTQDAQSSSLHNGVSSGETSHSNAIENLPTISSSTGLLQTPKGSNYPHINPLSEHLSLTDGNISWSRSESHGSRINEISVPQTVANVEKKRTRNIGSKSKRLLMHSEDALELRLTWEEAQDLLRAPPSVNPSIVTIEDHEFEEYDEAPIFGKRTLFTARPSGVREQWAQCDDCSKWRRLPIDVLLPPKWTCVDNVWNSSRCSCSAPEEISPKELENLLRVGRDIKKRRALESHKIVKEREASGLDALASAAVMGEKIGDSGESSMGATTKHPRHRPGCTCIVCIQPPSGKGKHKPTCTCNVCLTVKRRFKTLMQRKKKRQSEHETEMSQKENKDDAGMNGARQNGSENEGRNEVNAVEKSSGQIDLNCHPSREDMQVEEAEASITITTLVEAASMHLEHCEKQDKPANLLKEAQHNSNREEGRRLADEEFLSSVGWEGDNKDDSKLDRNGGVQ